MADMPSYQLDILSECLWRTDGSGEPMRVTLPPKSFQLLRHLIGNKGRVVTTGDILEAVWPQVHVQPEVVKTHILTIRQALGDRSDQPRFIETVRGRGYRFIGSIGTTSALAPDAARTDGSPFVGREDALATLSALLCQARSGTPQVVFVTGEAGIGKTAVVRQLLAQVGGAAGHVVGLGQCVESTAGGEPYYPVLEALAQICAGPLADAALRALVTIAPSWAAQMPGQISQEQRIALQPILAVAGRDRMLREGCEFFERLASQQLVILVLENLHWSDFATLDFLSAIARRRSRVQLLVIATLRPEDVDGGMPLQALMRDLLLSRLCHEIALEPLTDSDIATLVGDAQDMEASQGLAKLLRQRSGGNPLFMQATLDHLVERGVVRRASGGGWLLEAPVEQIGQEPPATLGRLIETRFERLQVRERQVLQAASAAGSRFCPAISAAAAEMDLYAFEDACENLCRRMLYIERDDLRLLPDGSTTRYYRFRHDLYRQVLRDLQGPARLARLHGITGRQIEAIFPADARDSLVNELAAHFAAAAEWSKALTYLRAALRMAIRRFAYRDALALLDQADDFAAHLPVEERSAIQIEFLDRRAAIHLATRDPRAADTHARLVEMAVAREDVDSQVRCLLRQAQVAGWHDRDVCLNILGQIEPLCLRLEDPAARALAQLSIHIRRIWVAGWDEQDAKRGEEAVAFLRARGENLATARAAIDFSMIALLASRYRSALQSLRGDYRVIVAHADYREEADLPRALWMHDIGVPVCLLFLGDFAGALTAFGASVLRHEQNGNRAEAQALEVYRALVFLFAGRVEPVFQTCRPIADALLAGRNDDPAVATLLPIEERLSLILCGLAEMSKGDRGMARIYLAAAAREMDNQPSLLDWYWRLTIEWGWVNIALGEGDIAEAATYAERLLQQAEQTGERTWRAFAWDAMARVALRRGAYAEALEHVGSGLAASHGYETPLATWRLHDTAAAAHRAMGNSEKAAEAAERRMAAQRDLLM